MAAVPAMAGPSTSRDVAYSHQLWSQIPSPFNALMRFQQEKRRSVAGERLNENNQRVGSRLGKLWICAVDKEPHYRKAAEFAVVHRRRYPDYVLRSAWSPPARSPPGQGNMSAGQAQELGLPGSVPDVQGKGSSSPALLRAPSQGGGRPKSQNLPASVATTAEVQPPCTKRYPCWRFGRWSTEAVPWSEDHVLTAATARTALERVSEAWSYVR
ncbi:hypothetical protein MTO96_013162 [Rhipicephalus appendiculatus]